jgi:hypothetical protein
MALNSCIWHVDGHGSTHRGQQLQVIPAGKRGADGQLNVIETLNDLAIAEAKHSIPESAERRVTPTVGLESRLRVVELFAVDLNDEAFADQEIDESHTRNPHLALCREASKQAQPAQCLDSRLTHTVDAEVTNRMPKRLCDLRSKSRRKVENGVKGGEVMISRRTRLEVGKCCDRVGQESGTRGCSVSPVHDDAGV